MASLVINGLLAVLIFGYAGFTLYREVRRRRQGTCEACALRTACDGRSCRIGGEPVSSGGLSARQTVALQTAALRRRKDEGSVLDPDRSDRRRP
ncbi:hypothetical protein AB1399_01985 [Hydrogenibacillus schlegelii]|nr:hypothetical protein [Hydrogenibacillus schlegelii]MBT9282944.1 hypothetical protein [Hydrogenibacillus schlegelii]